MLLKWIYEYVTILLCLPLFAWNAIISLIMWDSSYWDRACAAINLASKDNP